MNSNLKFTWTGEIIMHLLPRLLYYLVVTEETFKGRQLALKGEANGKQGGANVIP